MDSIMAALIGIVFAAFAFFLLKYVPSRREFEMHTKQDDERYLCIIKTGDEIKMQIRELKGDLIRELKNGNGKIG